MKQKHKTAQSKVPPVKVVTENQLQEHLKNLKDQLTEGQTKVVMLQGAIQMVELQIRELNPQSEDNKITNGVS